MNEYLDPFLNLFGNQSANDEPEFFIDLEGADEASQLPFLKADAVDAEMMGDILRGGLIEMIDNRK